MPKPTALVFDFDGTLFDTRENITNAVNKTRRQFGASPYPLREVVSWIGHGARYLAEKAFSNVNENFEVVFAEYMKNYYDNATLGVRPYNGVVSTLPLFDLPLHIISNKPQKMIFPVLEKFEIKKYFDVIIGGDTLDVHKPDPKTAQVVADKHGCKMSKLLMIGDHEVDIQFAKSCGMKSVFCTYGFSGSEAIGADHRISKFADLLEIIASSTEKS